MDTLQEPTTEEQVKADEQRRSEIVEMAREIHESEGTIEIDDNALVSDGADNGVYVAAWVWVPFDGTKFDREAKEES